MSYRTIHFSGLLLLLILNACSTSKPISNLRITNCAMSDIKLVPVTSVSGSSKRWLVTMSVEVTCADSILKAAKVNIKYPWLPGFTTMTESDGISQANRKSSLMLKPRGAIVMSIKTSNGILYQAVAF